MCVAGQDEVRAGAESRRLGRRGHPPRDSFSPLLGSESGDSGHVTGTTYLAASEWQLVQPMSGWPRSGANEGPGGGGGAGRTAVAAAGGGGGGGGVSGRRRPGLAWPGLACQGAGGGGLAPCPCSTGRRRRPLPAVTARRIRSQRTSATAWRRRKRRRQLRAAGLGRGLAEAVARGALTAPSRGFCSWGSGAAASPPSRR